MKRALFIAVTVLAGCSSDDSGSSTTVEDAAGDLASGDGITATPDEGVDTTIGPDMDAAPDTGTPPDTSVADTPADAPLSPSNARINEVYIDRDFEGDLVEWVEIAAPPNTPLDALWIRVIDKGGAPVFNLPVADGGAKMKPSGLWVVGSNAVAKADKGYDPIKIWGLPNDGGSIQLTRNDGVAIQLVDVVGYGTAPASTATEPKKTIETAPAALPPARVTKTTIGRKSVPGDTDDNSKDFCVMAATPGVANGSCTP